jgi:hypothetical protein
MGDARQLIAFARELLGEMEDGIDIEIVKTADGSIIDFLSGKAGAVLPFAVRVKPKGEDA